MTQIEGLPQSVADRAAELLAGSLEVVPLRDAATVALLRDGRDGLEVYMQRRTSTLAFAPGMYVFPGGRVEDQDGDPDLVFDGEAPQLIPFASGGDIVLGRPGPQDPAATYRRLLAAAVRETLEESGVLLAMRESRPADPETATTVRDALLGGQTLAVALNEAGVRLSFDLLVGYSHWMTPAVEIRRYDTRFFLARVPDAQEAHSASSESDEGSWVQPAQMLQRLADREVVMLPPTTAALTALAAESDAASAIAAGHRQSLRPVLPHPFEEDGQIRWRLIDGYAGTPWPAA